jgi:hypothetical protein
MKFARKLKPASSEEIQRSKERVTIRPPTLGEQIDFLLKKRKKRG